MTKSSIKRPIKARHRISAPHRTFKSRDSKKIFRCFVRGIHHPHETAKSILKYESIHAAIKHGAGVCVRCSLRQNAKEARGKTGKSFDGRCVFLFKTQMRCHYSIKCVVLSIFIFYRQCANFFINFHDFSAVLNEKVQKIVKNALYFMTQLLDKARLACYNRYGKIRAALSSEAQKSFLRK